MNDKANFRAGVILALASAATFGFSGPFAKSLMAAGWSLTAVVTARLATGAAVMVVAACIAAPGWFSEARRHAKVVVLYGIIPVAGAQFCYFGAVRHMSVGVAMLLEFLSPILVIAWIWLSTRQRPHARVLAGAALALVGMLLVLNIFSGSRVEPVGVLWGLGAAICAAYYFISSHRAGGKAEGLQPITLTTSGLLVGTIAVGGFGLTGIMPMTFSTQAVQVAGWHAPVYVPILILGVVTTAIAYLTGIAAIARLKPSYASLIALTEVLCAVIAGWVLLGETIAPIQYAGAAVILAGLVLAHRGADTPADPESSTAGHTASLPAGLKSHGSDSELSVASVCDATAESTPSQ
ncbi:EamA family transporter [Mycobacteroides salmoniphilum]|uniref:EamA family transporter n=1 Tax=Mycobacteroides salmoniphilum TaxID=404941 RepID=UPI0009934EBB|nr:EamA family transporter [Mycobacteroides salmoniphilum]